MDLSQYTLDTLYQDGEVALCRGLAMASTHADPSSILLSMPASEHPGPVRLGRLQHEFAMRAELDPEWAALPLMLVQHRGRAALVLADLPAEPLCRRLAGPMEIGMLLRLAVGLAVALRELHRRGLIHKDIKPAHVLINAATGKAWLTGFGIASRLPRERQAPLPPETIAGTLAYMAPEQTGRMNRSIDARSDLYALGVTLYEMLTGSLPFTAADPIEWVHCHIARQPMPPGERAPHVPAPVSSIVLKLLAKTPEERYQTAAGLECDLRRCMMQFNVEGRIDDFVLGERDTPDQLLGAEKLYGRAREIEVLVAAFERIARGGVPEMVLVSGYSGIGKSAVVNEVHKVLVPPRGLFAAGKFDQYKRDIPYATLAQAFQGLVRPLLAKSDAELGSWREALRVALGPNGQLMVDLVPELKLIIGEQAPVADLAPQDAQRRFQLVLRRLMATFARPEHPLVLFLDDLQWLDAATLDLLEDLLTHADVRHVLLVGAYRDNEVGPAHPLVRTFDRIRRAGAPVRDIVLAPLAQEHVAQLIADSLHCDRERVAPLAELVHQKTAGNPFFVIQFVSALVEEGLLVFDHGATRWSWDLARIHAKGYTDNVVELMVDRLRRLPTDAQKALQQLACLGNSAQGSLLALVREGSKEELDRDLQEALRSGLVLQSEGSCRFLHDRVQEAAYSLIPQAERAQSHLRIGQLLAAQTPPEEREEAIFEIVNQLNRGAALITARDEREQLAEFNLMAGKRAKASTAYVSALKYLVAGANLLSDGEWERRPDLMFALELHRAACEFLTGELIAAETRLATLSSRAANRVERSTVACLQIDLYMTRARNDRAIEVCLDYLSHLGIAWSPHPAEEESRREYDRIWLLLGRRDVETLAELPLMREPESVATMNVLTNALTPALYTDTNLLCLLVCRMIDVTLEHGNTDGSCLGYAWLGRIAGSLFGDYQGGFRFGKLGRDLVERDGLERYKARAYINFANYTMPWTQHVRDGQDLLRRAYDAANSHGDVTHAAFSCNNLITNLLAAGDSLVDVQREAERGRAFARKTGFDAVTQIIGTQLGLVRTLRGLTPSFGCLSNEEFDELQFELALSSGPRSAGAPIAEFRYWTRKLQARFLAWDYEAAIDAALNAQRFLWTMPSVPDWADAQFYGALSHAACCDAALPLQRREHVDALVTRHTQLVEWAANCPENFGSRAALVGAEIARIEGRELDAERLYEEAIKSARENDFVHNEAVANELAARFYAARGFGTIAQAYLRNARYGYLRWGADGKVRQLDEFYPHLKPLEGDPAPTGTIGTPLEQIDLATVIKVSQTISGEMVLDRLLDTLMRTALEHAGAERAVLILSQDAKQRIVAEAATRFDTVAVKLLDEPVSASMLPETIFRYVLHTGESVLLDDAAVLNPYSADPYVGEHRARSVLCLPLTNQAKLIGVLYLENNLAPHVFVPARTAVLRLLASQAAVSLENTRLYRDLAEREARIRRLVDANIIGIFIWELEGRILEANDAFLAMTGYDRDDLVAPGLQWTELTPPDWRDRDLRLLPQLKTGGSLQPFEKEFFRKDGGRVPVLVGVASFEGSGNQGVAYVVDLTDRKRAQEALDRASAELAHVSRVTALSALTASIAHEVNQPLSGIVTNAGTCLRMLDAVPPNVEGARETARRTIRDGNRASDVISRLRALFSKREFTLEPMDLNEAAREVLALSSTDLQQRRIVSQLQLAEDLPVVMGDRVQLQQVILNLVRNASDAMVDVQNRPRYLLIRSEREEVDQVRLTVRDSGVGLSPQSLASLFDAFYTTKSGGMGIGLFVSRSIIVKHHGRLWAEANEGAPGAAFSFSLPRGVDGRSPG